MRAVIFAAAPICDYSFYRNQIQNDDYVICADGGIDHLDKMGITPAVIIGDFDSAHIRRPDVKEIVYPKEKDETDTALCVNYAIERGVKEIVIFGGLAGRIEHTIANIHLLKIGIESNVDISLIDEQTKIFLVKNGAKIHKEDFTYLSAFPFDGIATGITYQGLKYPLSNAQLLYGNPLGISNEFIGATADIRLRDGILLIILSKRK